MKLVRYKKKFVVTGFVISGLTCSNFDLFVAYASINIEQLSFWQNKRKRFPNFNSFLKPTQHDLNTNPNDYTTAPSVENSSTKLFSEQKQSQNFYFSKVPNIIHFSRISLTTLLTTSTRSA